MQSGFFSALFNLSFRHLVTPRVIKGIYLLAMIVIAIAALVAFIASLIALGDSPAAGILGIILTPLFALLYLVYARVGLEIVIALFHIMQNTSELVRVGGGRPATSGVFAAPAIASSVPPSIAGPGGPGPQAGGPGQTPQEAGWYPDPRQQARLRYFDGNSWTEHTAE